MKAKAWGLKYSMKPMDRANQTMTGTPSAKMRKASSLCPGVFITIGGGSGQVFREPCLAAKSKSQTQRPLVRPEFLNDSREPRMSSHGEFDLKPASTSFFKACAIVTVVGKSVAT